MLQQQPYLLLCSTSNTWLQLQLLLLCCSLDTQPHRKGERAIAETVTAAPAAAGFRTAVVEADTITTPVAAALGT